MTGYELLNAVFPSWRAGLPPNLHAKVDGFVRARLARIADELDAERPRRVKPSGPAAISPERAEVLREVAALRQRIAALRQRTNFRAHVATLDAAENDLPTEEMARGYRTADDLRDIMTPIIDEIDALEKNLATRADAARPYEEARAAIKALGLPPKKYAKYVKEAEAAIAAGQSAAPVIKRARKVAEKAAPTKPATSTRQRAAKPARILETILDTFNAEPRWKVGKLRHRPHGWIFGVFPEGQDLDASVVEFDVQDENLIATEWRADLLESDQDAIVDRMERALWAGYQGEDRAPSPLEELISLVQRRVVALGTRRDLSLNLNRDDGFGYLAKAASELAGRLPENDPAQALDDVRRLLFEVVLLIDAPLCQDRVKRRAAGIFERAYGYYRSAGEQIRSHTEEEMSAEAIETIHAALQRVARSAADVALNCAEGQIDLLDLPTTLLVSDDDLTLFRAYSISAPPPSALGLSTPSGQTIDAGDVMIKTKLEGVDNLPRTTNDFINTVLPFLRKDAAVKNAIAAGDDINSKIEVLSAIQRFEGELGAQQMWSLLQKVSDFRTELMKGDYMMRQEVLNRILRRLQPATESMPHWGRL